MDELTIKDKILKTLLESPKTTGEIAMELGYIDEKGHGRYNIIGSDLNTLEQYGFIHRIEKKEKRPGAPATTYDIVYKYDHLRKILKKYPFLISDLQKSDKILSMLTNNVKPDTFVETFKNMLRLSSSFFENFLMIDSFRNTWIRIHCDIIYVSCINSPLLEIIIRSFEHCVVEDRLKGVDTWEAINLLNDLKRGATAKELQITHFELTQF